MSQVHRGSILVGSDKAFGAHHQKEQENTMRQDDFGDRMKDYEAVHDVRIGKGFPVVARLDGRSFSKFTKGMDRPFDFWMTDAMQKTMTHLVEGTHAKIGYTQSDEITLIYEAPPEGEMFFDGRVMKLASVLAGMGTAAFVLECEHKTRVRQQRPHFDCRVFGVPSRTEAANALLWRSQDCRKNSVQMIARSHFSHKQLHGKSQNDMITMLGEKGVTVDDYPKHNVYGTYGQRRTGVRDLTDVEWDRIPEASRPATRAVTRSKVEFLDIGYFGDVKNRESVIFDSEEPDYG